jgi:dihydrophenazinedicarboxylate synthase
MRVMITWWDLAGSRQTIDSLREYLRDEGVHPWSRMRGLRLKCWIADRDSNRWGAVTLWESADAIDQELPPHRALELIGLSPSVRQSFDVEATVEGVHSLAALSGRGLAFDQGSLAGPLEPSLPEFEAPPADPIALLRDWLTAAQERGVSEPTAVALATADRDGRASNRIVRIDRVTDEALIFTSHATSRKGRDLETTGWASGAFYWRETRQQVIASGQVERLGHADSDAEWARRPVAAQATSVVSHQSAPLADEGALRLAAQRLSGSKVSLPRPERWSAYELVPTTVEFWHGRPDGLHERLRYDRVDGRWSASRLQP